MKPAHFFFLFVAAILGYAAYDHAASVKASFAHDVGAGAVGEFLDRAQVADGTLKEAGSIVTDVVHVLRKPAAAAAPAAVNDTAIHDELRGEIEALKSRVGTLERQPVCTCNQVANAPAPQAAEVPQVIYQDACANGNCPGGRRRGRWAK